MNSGEGTPQNDVDLNIPTIERFNVVQQNWDEVVEELAKLRDASKHDLTGASNKTTKYCMSTLPYFTALLRSVEDEPEEAKIDLIASAIFAMGSKQAEDISKIYPDMQNPPEMYEKSDVASDLRDLFEEAESEEELVSEINDDFMNATLMAVNSISTSELIVKKAKKSMRRESITKHVQDVAKIAGGTALGMLAAQRLLRRRT